MAALTPEDVDLASGGVRVNKSLSEVAGRLEMKEPKSRAGIRVAVFHSSIPDDLTRHLSEFATAELMFPSPKGRYLRRAFARRVFKPSVAAAGLESDSTLHSLRNTYGTLLAELGATPRSISDLLGHAQVSTTLDLYSSRFEGEVNRMAELDTCRHWCGGLWGHG
jgi:site-specific recombinase XerD